MKNVFVILALSFGVNAFAAQTLDEALAKTKARWELSNAKKAQKDTIRAQYKDQIARLRQAQKAAMAELKTN